MSDSFSDTQQRFAHRIKDGRVCHTLLPTLNKFEKVSNSPTQRSELKTNPNIFNLFWNRIPNISHVPVSLKETVAVEQSLVSGSSTTTFSPSRWWPGFVPFTRRSFCPWMIQLSPSCRSPFQRPVAVWLRASPSNAPFVTLKRRQLVCGVCLLCDS